MLFSALFRQLYLALALGSGTAIVVHNHVPLDPAAIGALTLVALTHTWAPTLAWVGLIVGSTAAALASMFVLVVLSITGFGHDGPEATRSGYDQIAQGEAGLMSLTGSGPDDRQRVGVPIVTQGMGADPAAVPVPPTLSPTP